MKTTHTTILLVLLTGMLLHSCKKNSTNNSIANNSINYSFSYTGTPSVGDTIIFQSTAPKGSTFLWNFGDDSMSTDSMPNHIYYSIGNYVVTLMINGDSGDAMRKILVITDPPGCEYTHLMAGTWPWHGNIYPYMGNFYMVNDTSIAVVVSNDITVSVGGVTMHYTGFMAVGPDSVLEFSSSANGVYDTYNISYDTRTDSMTLQVDEYHVVNYYLKTF